MFLATRYDKKDREYITEMYGADAEQAPNRHPLLHYADAFCPSISDLDRVPLGVRKKLWPDSLFHHRHPGEDSFEFSDEAAEEAYKITENTPNGNQILI